MNGATFLKRLFQVWNINLDGTQEDLVFEQQDELVHDKSFITELFDKNWNSSCTVISPIANDINSICCG